MQIRADIRRDGRDGIARLALAGLAQAAMDVLHEGVEMGAALTVYFQRGVEQVHQHGFSAPDAAPHVDAFRLLRCLAEELPEKAGFLAFLQGRLKCFQPRSDGRLLIVRA